MTFKPYFCLILMEYSPSSQNIETIQSPNLHGILSEITQDMPMVVDTVASYIKPVLRNKSEPLAMEAIVILDSVLSRQIDISKTLLIHQKGFSPTYYAIVKAPVIDHASGKTTLYVKALCSSFVIPNSPEA